jgi:hypothetical protein
VKGFEVVVDRPNDDCAVFARRCEVLAVVRECKCPDFVVMGGEDVRAMIWECRACAGVVGEEGERRAGGGCNMIRADAALMASSLLEERLQAVLGKHDVRRQVDWARTQHGRRRNRGDGPCRSTNNLRRESPSEPDQDARDLRSAGSVHIIRLFRLSVYPREG